MRTLTIHQRYLRLLPVALALIVATAVTAVFAFVVLPADDDPTIQAPTEVIGEEVGQIIASPQNTDADRGAAAGSPGPVRSTRIPTEKPKPSRTSTPNVTATPAFSPTPQPSPTRRPPAASDNLVSNAGFSSDLDGWYTEGQAVIAATGGRNAGPAIRVGPNAGYADQSLSLEVGKTYRLQAWGQVSTFGQSGVVGIQYWDADGNRLESLEPTPLTFDQTTTVRKSLQFAFPEGVSRSLIYIWNKGGLAVLTIDDVSVRELIAPASTSATPVG